MRRKQKCPHCGEEIEVKPMRRGTRHIYVSEELMAQIKAVEWVRWSAVARKAFRQKLRDIQKLNSE